MQEGLQDLIVGGGGGWALTEVKGGARVKGAEPDQGQQDEAGSEQQDQKVEQQQEAQEGEVGLDSGAKEACEEGSGAFGTAPGQAPAGNPRADQAGRVRVTRGPAGPRISGQQYLRQPPGGAVTRLVLRLGGGAGGV